MKRACYGKRLLRLPKFCRNAGTRMDKGQLRHYGITDTFSHVCARHTPKALCFYTPHLP